MPRQTSGNTPPPTTGPLARLVNLWIALATRTLADPKQDARPAFRAFARKAFDENRGINKRDFGLIEYQLRKGKRQLELYSSPGVRKIDMR